MICQFLILNCPSSDSITSIISLFFTSLVLKFTVKIQVSLSNLCNDTPFNSSRVLPISFGHPNQRNPPRITIPSTSKVAVFILSPYLVCRANHPTISNNIISLFIYSSNFILLNFSFICCSIFNSSFLFSGGAD